jgi:hypothetical protein
MSYCSAYLNFFDEVFAHINFFTFYHYSIDNIAVLVQGASAETSFLSEHLQRRAWPAINLIELTHTVVGCFFSNGYIMDM